MTYLTKLNSFFQTIIFYQLGLVLYNFIETQILLNLYSCIQHILLIYIAFVFMYRKNEIYLFYIGIYI